MDDPEIKLSFDDYLKSVNWLRDHVAPDDIYEFAQQTIMAAEYLIVFLHKHKLLEDAYNTDQMMAHWISNVLSLEIMKNDGFEGILDVSWRTKE